MLGFEKHLLEPVEISLDAVVNYARRHYLKGTTGELIERVFYHDSEMAPRESTDFKNREIKEENKKVIIQEEVWRKFGLVIVKRASGKFITWEPIK